LFIKRRESEDEKERAKEQKEEVSRRLTEIERD